MVQVVVVVLASRLLLLVELYIPSVVGVAIMELKVVLVEVCLY